MSLGALGVSIVLWWLELDISQYQNPHLFFKVVSKLRVVLGLGVGYKVQGKDGGRGLYYSEQILLSPSAAPDNQCFRGILSVSDQYRSALFLSPFYRWDMEKGRDLHKDDTGE